MTGELLRTLSLFAADLPDPPTVFEGGSTVRGWANRHSDRDLYAILPHAGEPTDGLFTKIPCGVADGHFYRRALEDADANSDLQIWRVEQVESLMSAMHISEVHENRTAGVALTNYEIDFLGRLWHGRAISGHDEVARWQRYLHTSDARQVMADRNLRLADNATEDAVGQWETGDVRSATLATLRAYGHAVDAALAMCGEFSASSKWRARRVEEARPAQMDLDEYWAVETMRDYHKDPEAWVEDVLATCQTIAASIEL
ncbi:hypothetical protein [Streptomyces sp. NRRL F-2799]|uniref:hypothetical protein n=1 Tax=Streptomyces sp. NRRL F-2799 TaxID=1463844 RepID=UPI0004CC39D3|nr:hypothetical protein [Streptomyces sp. NRRL F-2799]